MTDLTKKAKAQRAQEAVDITNSDPLRPLESFQNEVDTYLWLKYFIGRLKHEQKAASDHLLPRQYVRVIERGKDRWDSGIGRVAMVALLVRTGIFPDKDAVLRAIGNKRKA